MAFWKLITSIISFYRSIFQPNVCCLTHDNMENKVYLEVFLYSITLSLVVAENQFIISSGLEYIPSSTIALK